VPDPVIEIKGLTKHFGNIKAVENLDLTIYRGEMFSLVGPDGAGKTTTIRMLCGIVTPTAGTATILGFRLADQMDKIKDHIGYLSQSFSLYGDLTIDENIEFFAQIHRVKNYKQRRDELLAFTRLAPFRDRLADRLSGGMKQKLALACTLIHTPDIIFLDEPTTGVDPVSRRDFWKILAELLKNKITIVMTSPYLDEAERSTRVGMLNQGTLFAADRPAAIKASLKGDVLEIVCDQVRKAAQCLSALPMVREVQAFGDRLNVVVAKSTGDNEQIRETLARTGIMVRNIRKIPPTLENVFIAYMKATDPLPKAVAS
jgi:ABC-2 type transport system ATP-binding protein